MRWTRVTVLLLCACRSAAAPDEPAAADPVASPDPRPQPARPAEPDAAPPAQPERARTAADLVARADAIIAVDVVAEASRERIAELPEPAVAAIAAAIAAHGVQADATLAAPPWNVLLRLRAADGEAFVVQPVGVDRARLVDATAPGAAEVVIGQAAFDAIAAIVGPPTAKEFRTPPDVDFSRLDAPASDR